MTTTTLKKLKEIIMSYGEDFESSRVARTGKFRDCVTFNSSFLGKPEGILQKVSDFQQNSTLTAIGNSS